MDLIKNRNKFFAGSIIFIIIGVIAFMVNGVRFDVDFKGGTTVNANLNQEFDNTEVEKLVQDIIGLKPTVQKAGADQKSVVVTTDKITPEETDKIVAALKAKYKNIEEPTTRNVQPAYGKELVVQSLKAIGFSLVCILIYITIRFRVMGVSAGLSAIIALAHDVLIMLSIYAIFKLPINSVFVAAILTIIGYSINDTLVVFDRIRENERKMAKADKAEVINASFKQVLKRCINTSITTVSCSLVLLVLAFVYNQQVLKDFAFPITIGLISGTYSSLFIASPSWYLLDEAFSKNSGKSTKASKTTKKNKKK